jgi:hypothetical protein
MLIPHRDRTPTGRGSVSMILADGGIALVWLNGRNKAAIVAQYNSVENMRASASQHPGYDHQHGGGGDHSVAGHSAVVSEIEMSLMFTMIGLGGRSARKPCSTAASASVSRHEGGTDAGRHGGRLLRSVREGSARHLNCPLEERPEVRASATLEGRLGNQWLPMNRPAISFAGQSLAVAWFRWRAINPKSMTGGGATFGA